MGLQIFDAEGIEFKNIDITADEGPIIMLDQCYDVSINGLKFPKSAKTVVQLIGKKTKNIAMLNVNKKAIADKIEYNDGAKKNAVLY